MRRHHRISPNLKMTCPVNHSWLFMILRIWQQIKKILNNNYDKSSINYFYFNQSDYSINKNHRHFAFLFYFALFCTIFELFSHYFCIFERSSAVYRSSLLKKGFIMFRPIRLRLWIANQKGEFKKLKHGNPTWDFFEGADY